MKKLWMRLFMITILTIFLAGTFSNPGVLANSQPAQSTETHLITGSQAAVPAGFQIVSSTATSLVLDLELPAYQVEQVQNLDKNCQVLTVGGYSQGDISGAPDLPSAGVMLGIPIGSTPSIHILSQEIVDIPGYFHLCPVARPIIQQDSNGQTVSSGESLSENPEAYAQDVFSPTQSVELKPAGMIRSQAVARLLFSPFRYNPARGELQGMRHMRVEIQLGARQALNAPSTAVDEGSFESVLAETLINYAQSRSWRSKIQPEGQISGLSLDSVSFNQPAYRIQVDQDGLYQVSYTKLQEAGVPVSTLNSLDPRTFRLYNQDAEIPIYVSSESSSQFTSTDYLLFYGQKITTKYTNTNVYWLVWGSGNGLRMPVLNGTVTSGGSKPSSFKTTLHLEEDYLYRSVAPSGLQNDHWYWYAMNAYSGPVSQNITFQLKNLAVTSSMISVRGLLKGYYAAPQHHTRISLNGHVIDDQTWPSTGELNFANNMIPQSYLLEGTNTLTVECPWDIGITYDQLLINWFEIDYYDTFVAENNLMAFGVDQSGLTEFQIENFGGSSIDVLDITNPLAPSRVLNGTILQTGDVYRINFQSQVDGTHRYLVQTPSQRLSRFSIAYDGTPPNLKSTTNGADYIIISPASFLGAIQELADYRANQGLRVQVIDVQDIYDEFNGGVFNPEAIHSFLAYTYSHWTAPAPSYVLLVGDGHYDFKNIRGFGIPFYIPPFLGEFDPWIGETASDNRYVTIVGDDNLPEMFIGRLPANSSLETADMVGKILSYEQTPASGSWNTLVSFVADNADSGGNFPVLSDAIASLLPLGYTADRVYYGTTHPTVAGAQAAILNAINDGRLIVNFTGHASTGYWASENLFGVSSIPSLSNEGRYPFFMPMTCQEGYFIFPDDYSSVAEGLVRAGGKGAIASFSATGFGLSNGHDFLARGLYQALFNDHIIQLGRATTLAKVYLATNSSGFLDLVDTYMLFGDPATRLKTSPTAVTLASFTGQSQPRVNELRWETASEIWAIGFNLYRSTTSDGPKQKVNPDLILARNPGQNQGATYVFEDAVNPGTHYYYWLEQVQIAGNDLTGPVPISSGFSINLPVVVR